jgi:ribosomal protein S18 acetylase RimI-like enzyme
MRRSIFSKRMIVLYCDLAKQTMEPANMPSSLTVQRLGNHAELSPEDLHEMTSFWNPKQAHRNIRERFEKGASLWLIRSGESLAGYSWSLRGRTIAHYYFPMAQDDVQLFDFYVFPRFRGRAILWFLITVILRSLREEGASRVFGDVAEWNHASLSFYRTVPFQRLGMARSVTIFGRTIIWWTRDEAVERKREVKKSRLACTDGEQTIITHPRG